MFQRAKVSDPGNLKRPFQYDLTSLKISPATPNLFISAKSERIKIADNNSRYLEATEGETYSLEVHPSSSPELASAF